MRKIDKALRDSLERDDAKGAAMALTAGADPNLASKDGMPMLHAVAVQGKVDLVNALLSGGATVDLKDPYGFTPLMWVSMTGCTPNQFTVFDALIAAGANPNMHNDRGLTPLDGAISLYNMPMINRLVGAKANVGDVQQEQIDRISRAWTQASLVR